MGFLEEIVNSLNQNAEAQHKLLLEKCNEHSEWLQKELQTIKNLIHQNPRDNFQFNLQDDNAKEHNIEFIDEIPAPSIIPEKTNGQKRKSPEVRTVGMAKDSPDMKRSIVGLDWEDVATNAGLPFDLNKLKKEQLLIELENCGINNFTMKDLKKDMIDSLKEHLLLTSRKSNVMNNDNKIEVNNIQNSLNNAVNIETTNEMIKSPTNIESKEFEFEEEPQTESNEIQVQTNEIDNLQQQDFNATENCADEIIDKKSVAELEQTNADELEVASDYSQEEVKEEEEAVDSERSSSSKPEIISQNQADVENSQNTIDKSDNNENVNINVDSSTTVLEQPSKSVPVIQSQKPQAKNLASSMMTFIPPNPVPNKIPTSKPLIVSNSIFTYLKLYIFICLYIILYYSLP